MAYAYTLSSGPERSSALSSVRTGFKECTETLCSIESRMESMMGTLLLEIKGIQGFARLCPGDVFEITIQHGDNQKRKTRGKILKNRTQSWDCQQILLKALMRERLSIKAVEVRGLAKNLLLGKKTCEIKDLFTARPQLMTINLNSIGTLKLNLIVTWNPLHCSNINDNGLSLGRNYHSSSSLLRLSSSKTLPNLFNSSFFPSKTKLTSTSLLSSPKVAEIIDADFYIHQSSPPPPSSVSSEKVATNDCKPTLTPTSASSSGSRGSSLHLTGTSGFGSASGSSYCGSSVPNSTLTSPETEIAPELNQDLNSGKNGSSVSSNHLHHYAPLSNKCKSTSINNLCLKQTTEKLLKEMGKSSQEIIVQATVHQSCSSLETQCETPALNNGKSLCSSKGGSCPQMLHQRSLVSAHSMANMYLTISDILLNFISSLEDIQGQYSEIHSLHQSILDLYSILKKTSQHRGLTPMPSTPSNLRRLSDARYSPIKHGQHLIETNNNLSPYHKRRASSTSDISVSIENALECFDFLNSTSTDSDHDSSPEHQAFRAHNSPRVGGVGRSVSNKNVCRFTTPCDSPLSQRYHLMEKFPSSRTLSSTGSTPSPINSPLPLSSGSEQLDIALMFHLNYCQRLLQNLGSFGPLKRREQRSLEKLQCQGMIIHRLTKLCFNLCDFLDTCAREAKNAHDKDDILNIQNRLRLVEEEYIQRQEKELSYLRQDSRTRKLWDTVCYQNCSMNSEEIGSMLICVTSGQFAQTLESYMRAFLTPSISASSNGSSDDSRRTSSDMYKKVAQLITARLIDTPIYEADLVVTIFQVAMFFRQENSGLEYLFKSYSEEISLIDSLQTENLVHLKKALNSFRKTLPPQEPLFHIALLLLHSDPLVVGIVEAYFTECNKNKSMRSAVCMQISML